MIKRSLLVLILSAFYEAQATTSCPPVQTIDSRDVIGLEKYITGNDFKSLECVISSLPTEVRAFRTYAKKSLSMQEASTKNPRAIVGSPDGGFFLTFNGHKTQKGFNEIEFLALDNNKSPNRWVPGKIKVVDGKAIISKNDRTCAKCHGNPVRPIWGEYPSWPNLYGSVDDWMPDEKNLGKDSLFYENDLKPGSYNGSEEPRITKAHLKAAIEESRQFREFRKYAVTHERYSALEKASDVNNPVHPYTEVYRIRNEAYRPNLIMGSAMAIRQNEMLAKRIKRNRFFKTYTSSLIHYFNCRTEKNQNEANLIFHSFLNEAFQHRFGKRLLLPVPVPVPVPGQDTYSYPESAFDLLGPLKHERTLLFANGDDYLPIGEQHYFSGFTSIIYVSIDQILLDLIESSWPDADKFIYPPFSDSIYDDLESVRKNKQISIVDSPFFGKELYNFLRKGYLPFIGSNHPQAPEENKLVGKQMCERLHLESKKEMAESPIASYFVVPKKQKKNPWPKAVDSCISCHDSKDRVATAIPFSDPAKLAAFSTNYESILGYGNLTDAVEFYIGNTLPHAHKGGLRMPLGQEPLSPQEQKDVLQWIEKAIGTSR